MKTVIRAQGRSLAAHLIELLRACQALNTTESKTVAAHLGLAPATVNAYFQRISDVLKTTDRFSSVQQAQRMGYLLRTRENMLINGEFIEGNCGDAPGNSMPWATVVGWHWLCGTPQWIPPASSGGTGAIQFWGTADHGEAIYQVLRPARQLQVGQTYRFSAEYRFGPVRRDWPLTERQPMSVDFRIRASIGPLASYSTENEPGRVTDVGQLHYSRREPDHFQVPERPYTSEEIEDMRRRGGEQLVEVNVGTYKAGGTAVWEWEAAVLEWTADAPYDTITIHPTNHVVVGKGRSEAPYELGWGQVRRLSLTALPESGELPQSLVFLPPK